MRKAKKYILIGLMLLLGGFVLSIVIYFVYPDVAKLRKENPKKTAFMELREGEWKQQNRKTTIRQNWVPMTAISPYVVKAVIIAEDDKFWAHEGFDFEAMEKAIEKDVKKGKFRAGGSTISQQLAKNLYLDPSRNPVRKIKEAILTWRLEQNLSKKRILEIYLNVVEWGDGIFGIEAASRHYFGKPASALTPQEAARLVVVLPNPRKMNPAGASKYVERRADFVYSIMVRRGIVVSDYDEVMKDETSAQPPQSLLDKTTAPTQ
jgi:monofunctional biosynthetic peptidoglycan transglycosylase